MRILHTIEFYPPAVGGSEEVVRQISERLARRGHGVTVATSFHPERRQEAMRGVQVRGFRVRGNLAKGITGEGEQFRRFVREYDPDVVMMYGSHVWPTDLLLEDLPAMRGWKLFAPVGFSKMGDRRYAKYYERLPLALRSCDRLIFHGERYQDRRYAEEHGLGAKGVVIPNGAATEEFSVAPLGFRARYGITTRYMFLSVSNHYFAKGHSAVIKAFRGVGDDDATLVLIGERPHNHGWYSCAPFCAARSVGNPRIRVLSGVPRPWVVSAFQEADLFLFASRVECAPLVTYECFASRTPMVTTPVGNLPDHSGDVTLVESPAEMSRAIRRFHEGPEPFRVMAERAYRRYCDQHTWEKITDRYEALYREGAGG